ncbi:hypothetical protein [Burkholderia gladioli]|uniref:hypothetical protein n=1 Tax=Burkholderia gladioli TaxID=28095 RepID=UPI00163E8301|nr:hypothetical protein [Burkholderia gladioli]MDN7917335.1 hypothetical protein [Burkholderia gladioli]
MLLPLAADVARKKSLEQHLALVTLRNGSGNSTTVGRLLHTTYITYFVHEATVGRRDLDDFRAAEAALCDGAVRAKTEENCRIPEDGCAAVERVLARYDQHLASTPRHLIASAQDRLARFLATEKLSPIVDA